MTADLDEEKKQFDIYFGEEADEFELKLYFINPATKKRKEYVETFQSEVPHDDYIAEIYGFGHFWIMGHDKRGKMRSKNIFISEMAVKRIQKKRHDEQVQLNGGIEPPPPAASNQIGQLKEVIEAITPLLQLQGEIKRPTPIDDMGKIYKSLSETFVRNMDTVNNQAITYTKKLVNEKLEDKSPTWVEELFTMASPVLEGIFTKIMAKNGMGVAAGPTPGGGTPSQNNQEVIPPNPEWTQHLVSELKPTLELILESGDKARLKIINKIKEQKEYHVVTSTPQQIELFFETMSVTIGVEKAKKIMDLFGFIDEEAEQENAQTEEGQQIESSVG